MLKKILLLLILMITGAFIPESLGTELPWTKRKIQRKNTVSKTNRRAKSIQRKNGIGLLPETKWEEVIYV